MTHDDGQQRRQQHEPQRDAVHAHVVADAEPGQPRLFSTSWKPACAGSKSRPDHQRQRRTSRSDVHSATLRGCCGPRPPGSPRMKMMNATPSRGRNVTSESSGQSPHDAHPTVTEQVPADQHGDADQHDEGVVVDVAGLQPHRAACAASSVARAIPSGPNRSMMPTSPPRQSAQPSALAGRTNRIVVQLVEVPLVVEQRLIGPRQPPRSRAGRPGAACRVPRRGRGRSPSRRTAPASPRTAPRASRAGRGCAAP